MGNDEIRDGWGSWLAFSLLYLSYVVAYFCRRNYGFWLNGLLQRGDMDSTSASVFGSTMELAYGAGKLVAGPIADNVQPKALLVLTLGAAALCNAFMFQSGIYALDVSLWAVNGFAQAFIWPALAMIFFNWFGSSKAKGTLYSVLSTNQNVGSALTPLLLTPLVQSQGWRVALWGPALAGGVFCMCLLILLKERPSSTSAAASVEALSKETARDKKTKEDNSNYMGAVKRMLTSPDIWFLGLGYALLTTVRVGMSDWSLVMLRTHRLVKDGTARDCLIALEFGGFIGGLLAGLASDVLFKGRRVPVMVSFALFIAAPALWGVFFGSEELLSAFYFAFGFGAFGPHVLVGLLARELFPDASSTAGSFAKSLAQVGGALSGVPISLVTSNFGWIYAGWLWVGCTGLSGVAFALMLPLESSSQSRKITATEKKTQ